MKKVLEAVVPFTFPVRRYETFTNSIRLALLLFVAFNVPTCFSQWTRTFQCPAGHVYRDVREDAGREEFCEIVESGFLAFRDGLYRSWFSEGHPGSSGQYSMGREVGDWRECDRFGRCREHVYPAVYPREEQRRGFLQEVPISYRDGKYVMDFASCRSTWVTQASGSDQISLNIAGDYLYRCRVSYLPQSSIEHGGKGSYICYVPFAVGRRELPSLDLRKELPLLGLPQFCSEVDQKGEPLMIRDNAWIVATTVDVECATITPGKAGDGMLTVRLNQFASDLVRKAYGNSGAFNTLLCLEPIASPRISVDDSGHAALTYRFSSELPQTEKQERCVTEQFKCQMPCR